MKSQIKILTFLVISVFLHSCSQDILNYGNPFSRENFTELAVGTIGPQGGSVELDSVRVVIPTGAFDETHEIRILVNKRDTTFKVHGVSPMYLVSGFPEEVHMPIEFYFPHGSSVQGDTLVAIGEKGFASSLDTTNWAFHASAAQLNGGLVAVTFPEGPVLTGSSYHMVPEMKFVLLDGYTRRVSAGGHFNVAFPLDHLAAGFKVGTYFEIAYDSCVAMGFDLNARGWPAAVMVKSMDHLGKYTSYAHLKLSVRDADIQSMFSHGKFGIDLGTLSDDQQLLITAGHELFHLVQNLYEFSDPWTFAEVPDENWFMEATAIWFEGKFSIDPFYVSNSMAGAEMDFSKGLGFPSPKMGYGLSFLIKDLVEQKGEEVIKRIFEKIKLGELPFEVGDPVAAILEEIEDPVEQYWHVLLTNYINGHYYGGRVNAAILDNSSNYQQRFLINTQTVKQTASYRYRELSGQIFLISLTEEVDWWENSKLRLSVTETELNEPEYVGLVIYKLKVGKEISLLAQVPPGGSGGIVVDQLNELQDGNYELVVLLTNGKYIGDVIAQEPIELSIEVTPY